MTYEEQQEVYEIARKIAEDYADEVKAELRDEIRRLEIEIENLRSEMEG